MGFTVYYWMRMQIRIVATWSECVNVVVLSIKLPTPAVYSIACTS